MNTNNRPPEHGRMRRRGIATKNVLRAHDIEAASNAITEHRTGCVATSIMWEDAGLSTGFAHVHLNCQRNRMEETLSHPEQEHHDRLFRAFPDVCLSEPERFAPSDLTGRPQTE